MIIRAAKDSDLQGIKRVVFTTLDEYGLEQDTSTTDSDLDSVEQHYFANGGFFGVVEEHGEIVATVGLYRVDTTTCELRKMYACASQRGHGLGNILMDFSINKAREMGFETMVLETASQLKEAINLYRKYGFEPYEPTHLSSRCDQAMARTL